jgi:hypothetical protein
MRVYCGPDIESIATEPCTKCGQSHDPKEYGRSRRVQWNGLFELLSWPCVRCGHEIFTLPLDAPAGHPYRASTEGIV